MVNSITQKLERNLQNTLQYFELPKEDLLKTYGEGKWNIRQILSHIVDAETVLYDRIRRTISNPGQTVMGFEQDLWAERLEYDSFPLELSQELFTANRKAIIHLANKFYDKYGHLEVTHNRAGPRTLTDFFDKVLWHNEQHLEQIELALKQGW